MKKSAKKRKAESPTRKQKAFLQQLLHPELQHEAAQPEQFNIVQEYHKLKAELLQRLQVNQEQGASQATGVMRRRELLPPIKTTHKKKSAKVWFYLNRGQ